MLIDGRREKEGRKESSQTCPERLSPNRTCVYVSTSSKQVPKAPFFINSSFKIEAHSFLFHWSPSHKPYLLFYGKCSKTSWLKRNKFNRVHRFLCAICWHQPQCPGGVKHSGPNVKQYICSVHQARKRHDMIVSFYID